MTTIETKRPEVDIDDTNNVYYNIRIVNRGDPSAVGQSQFSQAVYNVNRTSAILENPNDYELAVVRFSLPASNIPIMVWGDQPYDKKTNPSSKVDKYVISMSFDGADVSKVLNFIPNSSGNDFYGDTIWNYQEIIDIINVAFLECFNDLKVLKPLAPPSSAPYMIYTATTRLCTLFAPQTYDIGNPAIPPAPPPTIQVYFNSALYTLFPSLPSFEQEELEPLSHQLIIKNNFNNSTTIGGTPYYFMEQEYSTLALWNDFSKIVFETDTIPVEPEYQPSQNDTTRRLITDFEPVEDINNREQIQYFGTGWKRYYDLRSHYPLKSIDIKAYWEDNDGKLYPIYIGSDEALTMKILFRKKITKQLEALNDKQDDD
jgi:hypothetical protein